MKTLGIVVNPFAGSDGRRIVTASPTHGVQDKVRYLTQTLQALAEVYPARVLIAQDLAGIALSLVAMPWPFPMCLREVALAGEPEDTRGSVEALEGEADLLLVLGGDGTQRQALLARPKTPVLPLPAGTNNAFAFRLDPAYAGLVAAAVLRSGPGDAVYYPKTILLKAGSWESLAVVDAALHRGRFRGARALWNPEGLLELALAFAEPWSLGLSALGAILMPVDRRSPHGALFSFGEGGRQVAIPWFPGHVRQLWVRGWRRVPLGEPWTWRVTEPVLLALDGEREVELAPGDAVQAEVCRLEVPVVDPLRVELSRSG